MRPVAARFALPENFTRQYKERRYRFGFGLLGELAYWNSYSRLKEGDRKEVWPETVERVVNGTFDILLDHMHRQRIACFSQQELTQLACSMYDRVFRFKFLPPGRGLWAMGTKIISEKGLFAALNNCSFVSTRLQGPITNASRPFVFAMDMLMLGIGVGFDTKLGESRLMIHKPLSLVPQIPYRIPDSREGYVQSVKLLLDSYFLGGAEVTYDYSQIRPKGSPIKCFGGTAAGAGSLQELHTSLREVLNREVGQPVKGRVIVDLMNLIGKSIIACNVRRSALVAFGEPGNGDDFVSLKNYKLYPERANYGWTSNNSIYAPLGMDYSTIEESIRHNGEPGIAWLENMRNYGRLGDKPNFKDYRAEGSNPCMEQTLESYELCCLVETFPHHHASLEEFKESLKLALLYAKIVTLGLPHWPESAEIVERNRRIGCSLSGIAQFLGQRPLHVLRHWCDEGYKFLQEYDAYLSRALGVQRSIKLTSIKPSGTVSLLAGATSGIHYPECATYIRRVRLPADSFMAERMAKAGYGVVPDIVDSKTVVVDIPVTMRGNVRSVNQVSMWEQLSLCAFMQRYWADNQISCTIKFQESDNLAHALNYYQYQLKGISFLPAKQKAYLQSPIEEISPTRYNELSAKITKRTMPALLEDSILPEDCTSDKFCDNDQCVL